MYPNLYYVFKDWFGVEWKALSFLNTFGLMVAMSFVAGAVVLSNELKRKEKHGLLVPVEEEIVIGKPASFFELFTNFILGFLFAYKLGGLFLNKPADMLPPEYIFSADGNLLTFVQHPVDRLLSAGGLTFYGGLILAAITTCWYAARKGIKVIHLIDAAAPVLLIGYAIGRIGCQVSGDGDWGVYNSAYITDTKGRVIESKSGDYERQLNKYSTYFINGAVFDSTTHSLVVVTDRKSETLAKVPHRYFKAPAFIPVWMVAYNYPQNVNNDGILLPGIQEDYNRVLPQPVFPTPFYETIICFLLVFVLFKFRDKITTPGVVFSIYLIMNGVERFIIEKIR
ncbi:MAG: prolipoprotein diacylglyceryl transferase, partial [Sphingobacteriales bacterium]|nr:prolipoprotein diacylglyceryl transferase [Sphingobacteriales bacterium]